MANSNVSEPPPNFVIEDNIIKGKTIEFPIKSHNIGEVILKVFDEKPNHVAQLEAETDEQTTFAEMKENSIRCALWMRKQGIGTGDVVCICTHNQLDAYIPCIATFYVGAIYNPWHHEVPLHTAKYLMELTRPKVIFSCPGAVRVLQEAADLVNLNSRIVVFGKHSKLHSLRDTMRLQTAEDVRTFSSCVVDDPRSTALILFSSGTTGLPKGVAHSYSALLSNLLAVAFLPTKTVVSLWYSSLYWISGTYCMLNSILKSSTRILHAEFHPAETCKVIEKYKVNWCFITPSSITYWCKANVIKDYDLKSLENIMTGGAKLSRDIMEEMRKSLPNVTIAQGYGMTEVGGVATMQTSQCKSIESVGFVVPNAQLKIIDVKNKELLGPNQPGELYVKSPTLMIGYYKNPTATEEAVDNEGWLHTGDKAYFAENGEVFIIDRLKEVMKYCGHQISPFEIEEVLIGHPGVAEAAVVPVPHKLDIEIPMAFVKKASGSTVTEDELVQLSSTLGDSRKLRGGVQFLEELPYTASGKLNRNELKEMAKAYEQ